MNKKEILQKVLFIEDHSEYILPEDATWNEAQSFVAEHYDSVYMEYQMELCGYVAVEY